MPLPPELRVRVAIAFAIFGGLVSFLLSVGLYFSAHDLGKVLINQTLEAEMEDNIARRQRNPHSLPPATVTLLGYIQPGEPLPPGEIRTLDAGYHHIRLQDISYRLLIQENNGQRFFLLYNETLHLRRESRFVLILAGGMVAMVLFSTAGGWWLAGRVIAPVVNLAEQVRAMGLEESAPLAPHFPQDELGILARVFDQRHAQLQAFISRERSFTADVSHELRTPLSVIQGVVEITLEDPTLSPRNQMRLERAQRAVRDMTILTQALLMLSREEYLQSRQENVCNLTRVLQEEVEQNRHLLAAKPIQVVMNAPPDIQVPEACVFLHIVVGNLVRNAFSYTQQGMVRLTLTPQQLTVSDTGTGIRAEELAHVFQRHYKGPMSLGAGIGLSLVKRICQQCQWEVSIHSRAGEGTDARLVFSKISPLDPPLTHS